MEVKEEETSTHEHDKMQGKKALSHEPDVKNIDIKQEPVALTKIKEEDPVPYEGKQLLTMAGLFDCWQAPKVLHSDTGDPRGGGGTS